MVDWLFRNRRTGEVTVAQFPNLALWIFIGAFAARWLLPEGVLADVARLIATGALLWWAGDEIFRGVNPWRRLLGTTVLALTVIGLVGVG